MNAGTKIDFRQRYRKRVLLPGAVILLITAILCAGGLIQAGKGTDDLSLMAQKLEVFRALGQGMDELALGQDSVGLCEQCIDEANSANPDRDWLDANVGFRMFDLYDAHETYILDGEDRPVYASVARASTAPEAFEQVAPAVGRFVKLVRGEARRSSGRSNLNERLPGSPPEPLVFPPAPGFSDEPLTVHPTVRTAPDVIHSTDLVRVGDKVAVVSVMRMARAREEDHRATAGSPLLLNLRYLDEAFLAQAAQQNYLIDARLSDTAEPREGEAWAPVSDTDGTLLTRIFWKPLLGGSIVVDGLLLPAGGMFVVVALLILLMSLKLRLALKQDEERAAELERVHAELTAKEAQAHHLAYHDVLTGLPNRAMFTDNADKALIRARHGEPKAILLLDLDRFKNVNDRFGHLAGDELIREVAGRLSHVIDDRDTVARLGGDEFAILLERDDQAEDIETTLNRILTALRQPFQILGNQAHVGVSVGVALAPEFGTDRMELMRKADIALYRAKDEGRDCYRYFTETMDESVQLRATLEAHLREALASGEGLSVHYQPLIDSAGGKVTGLEALLRWDHPEHGCVPPHMFVPVAEETGLISSLGDWVMQQACEVARDWPKLSIAVNLSPVQFCDEDFAERISGIVRNAGVSPHQIELEVTEGVVLDQNETVRGALRRLREAGFRIALDDFGTGYSSLSYLREFEVDRIKIDKSFVQNLGQAMDADAIVTAVVTLGHAMGLQVTAEGVETAAQETFLRSAGCNVLQGFLFAKAVPANELAGSMSGRRQAAAA
jgi:diguanylate cyclase (GGDEF)-like protein